MNDISLPVGPSPTFSVVMPLYNKRDFVRQTLETVLTQRLPPFEVIIVDDGSLDGSVEAIADLLNGPVRLIRQANSGPGPARNRGVGAATGEWIAFIDADDRWHHDHLANLADVIATFPDISMAVAASRWQIASAIDLEIPPAGEMSPTRFDYFANAGGDKIHISGTAVRRDAFLETKGFGAFCPGEDLEFLTRFAVDYLIARSPVPTAIYVRDNNGIMDTDLGKFEVGNDRSPFSDLFDRVLADDRYRHRHHAIAAFYDQLLFTAARNRLYVGNGKGAAFVLRSLRGPIGRRGRIYGLLALVPRPLLVNAVYLYSKLKKRVRGSGRK